VPTIDHVTVNDVAIGSVAYRTLQAAGCRSYALVNYTRTIHEALHVRGRAFLDRAQHEGFPTLCFAAQTEEGSADRIWPQPLCVFRSFDEIPAALKAGDMPGPTGIFLTLENAARELHGALKAAGLLDSPATPLIIAGTTPHYVSELAPPPLLIDIRVPQMISVAIERLIQRALGNTDEATSILLPPHLVRPVDQPLHLPASHFPKRD
jgi:DNA-binding LacI/PurR family transcriptional regulator